MAGLSETDALRPSPGPDGIARVRWAPFVLLLAVLAALLSFSALSGEPTLGDVRVGQAVQDTPLGAAFANIAVFLALPAVEVAVWLAGALVAVRTRNWPVLVAALLVLVALAVNPAAKELIARPRPGAGELIIRRPASGYGFPSGHTEMATLLYGFAGASLATAGRPMIARLCLALAGSAVAVIGFERVYDGAHWPSDVAGGLVFGLLLLIASWTLGQLLVSGATRRIPQRR
jgi:membrane-associated phospholipid phosphatase